MTPLAARRRMRGVKCTLLKNWVPQKADILEVIVFRVFIAKYNRTTASINRNTSMKQ